jgi:hypothetical protein
MSGVIDKARELSALMPRAQFEGSALPDMSDGRKLADEFAEAVQGGSPEPDLLMYVAMIAGKSGDVLLRGFLRGVQDRLRVAAEASE